MARNWKNEISAFLFYAAMLLVAFIVTFLWEVRPSGGVMINTREAWKNVEPYVWNVMSVFAVLGGLRLAGIYLINRLTRRTLD
jgi:hypothetical protein